MKNTVVFDISKVMFVDITGEEKLVLDVAPDFPKSIAQHMYYRTSNIELGVFAMDLYKSNEVSVNREQLAAILNEIPKLELFNPLAKSFTGYINSCLAELDKIQSSN